jgi:hypothetical protein
MIESVVFYSTIALVLVGPPAVILAALLAALKLSKRRERAEAKAFLEFALNIERQENSQRYRHG